VFYFTAVELNYKDTVDSSSSPTQTVNVSERVLPLPPLQPRQCPSNAVTVPPVSPRPSLSTPVPTTPIPKDKRPLLALPNPESPSPESPSSRPGCQLRRVPELTSNDAATCKKVTALQWANSDHKRDDVAASSPRTVRPTNHSNCTESTAESPRNVTPRPKIKVTPEPLRQAAAEHSATSPAATSPSNARRVVCRPAGYKKPAVPAPPRKPAKPKTSHWPANAAGRPITQHKSISLVGYRYHTRKGRPMMNKQANICEVVTDE